MITTDFVPGSPCWIDLGVPDVTGAAAFYRGVFGWELQQPDEGGYGLFRTDAGIVGGVGRLTERGARPAWTVYFAAHDADATAEAVRQAGGSVRSGPTDAGEEGRMVQPSDPLGARFGVWQAGKTHGFETADGPGSLYWTELYTTDAAAAKRFYGEVFGWTTEDTRLPGGGTYSIITPAGTEQNRMQGGLLEISAEHLSLNNGVSYWHPVFGVADCDTAIEAVERHGGSVQMGPETSEGVGRLAVCLDPAGADFVILAPAASAT